MDSRLKISGMTEGVIPECPYQESKSEKRKPSFLVIARVVCLYPVAISLFQSVRLPRQTIKRGSQRLSYPSPLNAPIRGPKYLKSQQYLLFVLHLLSFQPAAGMSVSIPRRQATNIGRKCGVWEMESRFQSLVGRLQTPQSEDDWGMLDGFNPSQVGYKREGRYGDINSKKSFNPSQVDGM